MIPILSTRKLNLQQRNELSEKGFSLMEKDFIRIDFIDFKLNRAGDLLLFTSQNAVRSVLRNPKVSYLKSIPCICVGEKTATLLVENGWKVIHFEEYAVSLGKYIVQNCLNNEITFFSGNLRRDILPNVLKDNKIQYSEIQVYRTLLQAEKINSKQKGILFFSPSGVQSFLCWNHFSDEIAFCIGKTTADEVLKHTKHCVISKKPTVESLVACVISYFSV
ncbi:uroporphyrinogen-III synthase [Capnocytophaga sp.]|uniref:uroporphyrinogen-III synthase n=1 Tax=Capnocytophaga sp. TaxID=44737 RepID=UPI0026DD62A3|nr:uroporphyrinogen-III synthase [Capnocytophaga sp.]MDO5104565.1 uroporphyrinogen-III synthase [Capnocytophaga sp.]